MSLRTATLLVAAALTLGAGVSPVAAQDAEVADASSPATIVLSPGAQVLDPEEQSFEFSSLIRNSGDESLADVSVTLSIAPDPLVANEQLHDVFPEGGVPFHQESVPAVDAEGDRTQLMSIPADDFPLGETSAPGVYLVRAELMLDGAATPAASTVTPIIWEGVEEGTVPLALIVPVVLPSEIHALPSRPQLGELAPRLNALLTEAESLQATLAIDPRVIAGIRAYGEDAPDSALALLERLETTALPSFLLQFADADPAAQAALGLKKLLQPEELGYVTRLGTFPAPAAIEAQDPASPDATGESIAGETGTDENPTAETTTGEAQADDADATPNLEQLLDWPGQELPTGWPAEGAADQATLKLLRGQLINRFVLSSDNVSLTGGPIAKLGNNTAIITDTPTGDATRDALTADTEVEHRAAVARAAAELALAAQTGRPGIVLGLDRGAVAEADDPAMIISQLAELDWVRTEPVERLPTGSAALRTATEPSEERLTALQQAVDRESEVNEVGAILRNPEYLESYQRDRLLEFFATRHASPEANFDEIATAYANRDDELKLGVRAVSNEHIQLVGTSTQLPVQLQNALPFAAIVNVAAEPSSAALAVPNRTFNRIAIPGKGNERVMIPVQTRVSSGESSLGLTITDVTGEYVTSENTLPITIRSHYERIALWTLGGVVVLLFIFGIIRSLRRLAARKGSLGE